MSQPFLLHCGILGVPGGGGGGGGSGIGGGPGISRDDPLLTDISILAFIEKADRTGRTGQDGQTDRPMDGQTDRQTLL